MPKAIPPLKPLTFLGSSRDDLREMPETVRHAIGVELMIVQLGGTPNDFKPITSIGTEPVRSASGILVEHFARCT
jgi:phage-related protein